MRCPICNDVELAPLELEQDLQAERCAGCGGTWISNHHYLAWRVKHPLDVPEATPLAELEVKDLPHAKFCPECGHLMPKYRIGHGLGFYLDHCGACGGFWLDTNEWAALKQHGLHDNLHQVPTAQWQKDLRQQGVLEKMEAWRRERLGAEIYGKVIEFSRWLETQPDKGMILAMLNEKPSGTR